jgi:hypothetical protein
MPGGWLGIGSQERRGGRVCIWSRLRQRSAERTRRNGGVKTSDDGGNVVLVEFFHCRLKVGAFLALDEQLSDLGTALHVLWPNFPHLALLCAAFALHVRRAERVRWVLALVLGLRDLGFGMPDLPLLVRHVLPSEPNDLREGAVVCLDLRRDVPTLNERRAEQDESIWRAGYIIICLLLSMPRPFRA